MKILLTTDTFYPMTNGVIISTMNLYRNLKSLGHDVRILTLSDTGEEKIVHDVYYLKSINVKIYPEARITTGAFSSNIINKIIDWHPDIVHSQTEFSTMIAAKRIVKKLNIPHIHTYHTMYEDYLKYLFHGKLVTPEMLKAITRHVLKNTDGIVAPTKKVKDTLINYGLQNNISIVPTGIDLEKFKKSITKEEKIKLLEEYGLTEDDNILLFVGRVAYEKNIDEIINMFSGIKDRGVKLLIVGGGPYLKTLQKKVHDMQLENRVIFTGMIKSNEIYKYYKLGKIFVTASTSETQGLTYVEAMASGLPVVCRYDQCIDELVLNNKNGFSYLNKAEFIYSIKEMLENEVYYARLSKCAKIIADTYSCENFAKNIDNVYKKHIMKYNSMNVCNTQYHLLHFKWRNLSVK